MKGLELARTYYMECGRAMIQEQFESYASHMTVGLCGEGSECFGFDDEISKDHDFGPAFCIWLDREVMEQIGEDLMAAYEALPACFGGRGRAIRKTQADPGEASVETYARGELSTYSEKTLRCLKTCFARLEEQEEHPEVLTMDYMARCYGYQSAEDAEQRLRQS